MPVPNIFFHGGDSDQNRSPKPPQKEVPVSLRPASLLANGPVQTAQRSRIVLVCDYPEALRSTILPLADALLATGRFVPVVILSRDPDGTMQRMCNAAGVWFEGNCRRRGFPGRLAVRPIWGQSSPVNRPRAPDCGDRNDRGVRRVGLLLWSARVLRAHWQLARWLRRSIARLRKLHPAAVVLLDDRTLGTCHWIRAAEWVGIPSVTVQWAAIHRQESLAAIRFVRRRATSKLVQIVEQRVASWIPRAAVQRGPQIAWLMPVEHTIAHHLFGAFPRINAWAFGGGNSNAVAVAGMAWKQRIVQDGVPEEKLVVTGHPDQDQWFRLAETWNHQRTAEFVESLQIGADKILVTLIAPAMAFRAPGASRTGDVAVEDLRQDLRTVVDTACSVDDRIVVVIKVHPRDAVESMGFLRDEFGVRVRLVGNGPLDRLIASSRVMVCQWSTAAMMGPAFQTPAIIVAFRDSPSSDVWKGVAGLHAAETLDQFRQTLVTCLHGPDKASLQLTARDAFVREHLCFDGRASERIVALIERHAAARGYSQRSLRGKICDGPLRNNNSSVLDCP